MPQVNFFGTHLSVPIDSQGPKVSTLQYVVDMVARKLLGWNNLFLCQSMKVVLINLVVVAMISHILATFTIPASTSNKIDFLLYSFFWEVTGYSLDQKRYINIT